MVGYNNKKYTVLRTVWTLRFWKFIFNRGLHIHSRVINQKIKDVLLKSLNSINQEF